MASILYYSNYCNYSKQLLQVVSKIDVGNDMHFICVDNRIQENGKTYIILEGSQKIILPDNIKNVPALLNLSTYDIIYGNDINNYFKQIQMRVKSIPQKLTLNNESNMSSVSSQLYQQQPQHPPQNNHYQQMNERQQQTEPEAFMLGSGGFSSSIVSDNFSFLDMTADDLITLGNGGGRQMHNYVTIDQSVGISTPEETYSETKNNKISKDLTIEQLQQQRNIDIQPQYQQSQPQYQQSQPQYQQSQPQYQQSQPQYQQSQPQYQQSQPQYQQSHQQYR